MNGKDHKAQGRGGTAPLLGQSSLTLSTFARVRNNRVAMHEALRVYRTAHSPSRTRDNHSLTVFGSLDFQTCRIADSSKSAGREAAPAVGLEICAAAGVAWHLTHNLSLSFVNSCQR
jgi:hypothetical protein